MTALSGQPPAAGVRYVFTLGAHDALGATYDVAVETAAGVFRAQVRIDGAVASAVGEVAGLDAAHAAQMIALAKTIGRRADDAPWPRRVERWRSPGVR
jgi:hypothetical protein